MFRKSLRAVFALRVWKKRRFCLCALHDLGKTTEKNMRVRRIVAAIGKEGKTLESAIAIGSVSLVALIAFIIGVKRGFSAMTKKPMYTVTAVFLAYFAMIALLSLFVESDVHRSLCISFAENAFNKGGYTTVVSSASQLNSAMEGTFWKFLQFNSKNIYNKMVIEGIDTFGIFVATEILTLAEKLVLWFLAFLCLKYFLKGLQYLLEEPQSGGLAFFDKALGSIWSLVWAYFILISVTYSVALIIVGLFAPDSAHEIVAFIDGIPVLKFLHETNGIGVYLGRLFGLNILAL